MGASKTYLRMAPLVFLFLGEMTLSAQEVVKWACIDLYPFTILEGPQKGTGPSDVFMSGLISKMSSFHHEINKVPVARIWTDLKSGVPLLYATALKNSERESFAYFSKPYILLPPIGIMLSPKWAGDEALRPQGKFDFDTAFTKPDFRLAVVRGRRYGDFIDLPVDKAEKSKILEVTDYRAETNRLYQLFKEERIGGIVGYEAELRSLFTQEGFDLRGMTFSGVMGEGPYNLGYVAAPKTPWGKKMIDLVNEYSSSLIPSVTRRYKSMVSADTGKAYAELSLKVLGY